MEVRDGVSAALARYLSAVHARKQLEIQRYQIFMESVNKILLHATLILDLLYTECSNLFCFVLFPRNCTKN